MFIRLLGDYIDKPQFRHLVILWHYITRGNGNENYDPTSLSISLFGIEPGINDVHICQFREMTVI